jgi:hypothetical protein
MIISHLVTVGLQTREVERKLESYLEREGTAKRAMLVKLCNLMKKEERTITWEI